MKDVLAEIVAHKKLEVAERQQQTPLLLLQKGLKNSTRSLKQALSNEHSDFILECKKASPSKGLIRKDFDLNYILEQYQDYASAISVLTDNKYFQGDFEYLTFASQKVSVPVLCKDFFVDPYQVYEARKYGADAILLMLSVLNDNEYRKLANTAKLLDLDILTEVHDESELDRAIALDAEIIGINNRNLKDLSIDLATTEKLSKKAPSDRIIISESGIETRADINRLAPIVNGFLVGSSIMAKKDIRSQCKALVYGQVKICGITRAEDAISIDKNGALYAGFIFYPQSARYIEPEQALAIVSQISMRYVGVFVDEEISTVIDITRELGLFAVQLHGNESDSYIQSLKSALSSSELENVEIWKATAVLTSVEIQNNPVIDRYLLDTFSDKEKGGTGETFDWNLLKDINTSSLMLAGGIDINNIERALSQEVYGIDLSSGIEIEKGIKSSEKIAEIFSYIRAWR